MHIKTISKQPVMAYIKVTSIVNSCITVNPILRGCGDMGMGKNAQEQQQRPPTPKEGANGTV
jgi:hypothetical protein